MDHYKAPRAWRNRYQFNDSVYRAPDLALAIVTSYVKSNPGITYEELLKIFPARLQGGVVGAITELGYARDIAEQCGRPKHFLGDDQILQLADCAIAVSGQWGNGNIKNLIDTARSIGYQIALAEDLISNDA
jgi:hypothetical protein